MREKREKTREKREKTREKREKTREKREEGGREKWTRLSQTQIWIERQNYRPELRMKAITS